MIECIALLRESGRPASPMGQRRSACRHLWTAESLAPKVSSAVKRARPGRGGGGGSRSPIQPWASHAEARPRVEARDVGRVGGESECAGCCQRAEVEAQAVQGA